MKSLRNLLSHPSAEDGILLAVAVAAALTCWIFGWESNGWQNVILLSAVAVAILSLRTARKSARQKATLIFLREYHNSKVVHRGTTLLNQQMDNKRSAFNDEDKLAVKEFLNQLELLAIGLKNGMYDEQMIRDAMETAIVRYYMRGKTFIEEIRRKDGDVREVAYEHFENLAVKISTRLKNSK